MGGDRAPYELSTELTVTLRRGGGGAGYGLRVKPVVIRSAPTVGPLVSGTYTILEVADVDAGGPAAAAVVLPKDILLEVCGCSVRSGGSEALTAPIALASGRGAVDWRFLRVKDQAAATGAAVIAAAARLHPVPRRGW